jgi:hypothetical protein
VRVHFADQKYILPPTLNRLANKLLGASFSIHFSRVDHGHPEVDAALKRRHLTRAIATGFTHFPSSQTQRGYFASGG